MTGPQTLDSLMNYVHETVHRLTCNGGRAQRFGLWMRRDFQMNSNFSGMMCWDDTFHWHMRAAAQKLQVQVPHIGTYRACDNDFTCQRVLTDEIATRRRLSSMSSSTASRQRPFRRSRGLCLAVMCLRRTVQKLTAIFSLQCYKAPDSSFPCQPHHSTWHRQWNSESCLMHSLGAWGSLDSRAAQQLRPASPNLQSSPPEARLAHRGVLAIDREFTKACLTLQFRALAHGLQNGKHT